MELANKQEKARNEEEAGMVAVLEGISGSQEVKGHFRR
jgi:hypothetical protein